MRIRSELAVPASSQRFMEKAQGVAADAIFLDLEDAVVPRLKAEARGHAIRALQTLDWGRKNMAVRINPLESEWGLHDVVDIVEACPRLDRILMPKCESADHVRALDWILRGAEAAAGRTRPVAISVLIETAKGVSNADTIAGAGGRLKAMLFGSADYESDMGVFGGTVGVPSPHYAVLSERDASGARALHRGDAWHYAMSRIANACRAHGLLAIDGPYGAIDDNGGLLTSARRSAALGFGAKLAIHPSQLAAINEVYAPSPQLVAWANEIMEAMRESERAGGGATRLRGEMVDIVHIRMAQSVLEQSKGAAA